MGRKRWRERRPAPVVLPKSRGVIRCGHPFGDGSMCMAPASTEHAATHRVAEFADELGMPLEPWQQRVMSAGLVIFDRPGGYVVKETAKRRPTYDVLRAASDERAQITTDQAQTKLTAARGTRPHLAARVIEKLGPVLAGELARAVDASVEGRISGYLSAERAELNRLYQDQAAKLSAEREGRGRDVNSERWTTPSRLS
jgi:hypothetical protein